MKWMQVVKRDRAWADTHMTHKMGWLDVHNTVLTGEVYQGWTRFHDYTGTPGPLPFKGPYKEWWVRSSNLGPLGPIPTPDPVPTPGPSPNDAELGAAFQTIRRWLEG